jgi:hypothetical protein
VAKHDVALVPFVIKPSKQGQVYSWVPLVSAQYVLFRWHPCEPSVQACCVGIRVGVSVGAAVGAAVGTAVGAAVGTAVGAAVGTAVGTAVGIDVGTAVGTAVGAGVGAVVGAAVGTVVGVDVGTVVGADVGVAVGAAVGAASQSCRSVSFVSDAAWLVCALDSSKPAGHTHSYWSPAVALQVAFAPPETGFVQQ